MPTISSLVIYPLKSARGVPVERLELDARGPRGDRRWMLADADGTFVSLRTVPRLAFVAAELTDEGIRISLGDGSTREVARPAVREDAWIDARVWGDACRVVPAEPAASEWLSAFLGSAYRLVHLPDEAIGPAAVGHGPFEGRERQIALTDGTPMLLANEASLADLNARLSEPIAMHRFRPNIVVDGAAAWDEDHWREVEAGGVRLRFVKGCPRCVATTVDQATGIKGVEPLRTLATFRKRGSEVYFGQEVEHLSQGMLSVGDPVGVIQ